MLAVTPSIGHCQPNRGGHARSTKVQDSMHGKSSVYVFISVVVEFGLSRVRFVRAGSDGWLINAGWTGDVSAAAIDAGSAHRGNDTAHAHDLYAKAQSSHVWIGEYKSRPQARVSRAIVKLVIEEIRGAETAEGRLEDVYVVVPSGGAGSGIAHAVDGQ